MVFVVGAKRHLVNPYAFSINRTENVSSVSVGYTTRI